MAQFTEAERMSLAKKGVAMNDGSYPIRGAEDLHNAIQSVGRAKNPAEAKKHIVKRARALMLKSDIPLSWM